MIGPDADRAGAADSPPADLRLLPAAGAMWAAVLAGLMLPWPIAAAAAGLGAVGAVLVGLRLRCPASRRAVAIVAACLLVGVVVAAARVEAVWIGPVSDLAEQEAYVTVDGVVTGQPELRSAPTATGGPEVDRHEAIGWLRVERITGRGRTTVVRTPVLLVGDAEWAALLPGQRVRVGGRLRPATSRGDVAAVFRVRGTPTTIGEAGIVAQAAEPFRAGLRASVDDRAADPRGLLPGLVIGDESRIDHSLREDMLVAGLAHLTAVSGSNVALVVVATMGVARWVGVRGYAVPVLGLAAVVAFVLLVRPDPSVLRAAVMGVVAGAGLLVTGRRASGSALAAAVIVLLLADPWLAARWGFVLSVLATAGIVTLVPRWQRALRWLPRSLGLAVLVPMAAQLACLPVVVAASGAFSLAALPANLLAAPAVAPATVLGLAAALVSPVVPALGEGVGWLAAWPAWWIAVVARWLAGQPGAALAWPLGAAGVVIAGVVAAGAIAVVPLVVRRPLVFVVAAAVLGVAILRPPSAWPPANWLIAACDVGQGDTFAVRAGERSAVVVDAGPRPRPVQRCLDALGVRDVPLLVISHFHADHVGGLDGVLAGREVRGALVSPLAQPRESADVASRRLAEAGVPVQVARAGQHYAVGDMVDLRVLWPERIDSRSEDPNDASVVLAATVGGVEVLLTGDIGEPAQEALARRYRGLSTDVLKVAHHGSADQQRSLLTGVGADVALIGVGANTYGHPADETLDALRRAGIRTYRTDDAGSIAVAATGDDRLHVASGGPRVARGRGRSRRGR